MILPRHLGGPAPALHVPVLLHQLRDLVRELVGLRPRGRLGVDSARILGTARAREAAAARVLADALVNLVLQADGVCKAALGVRGAEGVLVRHLDADEAVGEVRVGERPVLESPALVREDHLDKEHVGKGVANRLVDEVTAGGKDVERVLLRWGLGLGFPEGAEGVRREDDGAVAVRLKVDTDVELERLVMEVLNARGGTDDGKLEVLLDVGGAGAVRICRLDDTDAELVLEIGRSDEVTDEGGRERGNAVTVEHEETSLGVDPVVNQTIGVSVKRTAAKARSGAGSRGRLLPCLDEICTALSSVRF